MGIDYTTSLIYGVRLEYDDFLTKAEEVSVMRQHKAGCKYHDMSLAVPYCPECGARKRKPRVVTRVDPNYFSEEMYEALEEAARESQTHLERMGRGDFWCLRDYFKHVRKDFSLAFHVFMEEDYLLFGVLLTHKDAKYDIGVSSVDLEAFDILRYVVFPQYLEDMDMSSVWSDHGLHFVTSAS